MVTSTPQEITQMLLAWSNGDKGALEKLTPLVYAELHRLARRYMRRELPDHTLQTTALVNEAYMRLIDLKDVNWQDRAHFFGLSAHLMRRILVEEARNRRQLKRGGAALRVSLEEAALSPKKRGADLVALDDALKSLAEIDQRKTQIVELRFFGGLNVEETAEVLKSSPRTVAREWSLARAWLHRELGPKFSR